LTPSRKRLGDPFLSFLQFQNRENARFRPSKWGKIGHCDKFVKAPWATIGAALWHGSYTAPIGQISIIKYFER
jgi:hypothetical protein